MKRIVGFILFGAFVVAVLVLEGTSLTDKFGWTEGTINTRLKSAGFDPQSVENFLKVFHANRWEGHSKERFLMDDRLQFEYEWWTKTGLIPQ